jgi:hypothetical protein
VETGGEHTGCRHHCYEPIPGFESRRTTAVAASDIISATAPIDDKTSGPSRKNQRSGIEMADITVGRLDEIRTGDHQTKVAAYFSRLTSASIFANQLL